MKHQQYIEEARVIIETATTAESLYQRLKGLAMDFTGDFPEVINDDIGRKLWFDGLHSVCLDAGSMGARISHLDGVFETTINGLYVEASTEDGRAGDKWAIEITFGVYILSQGEWLPSNASIIADLDHARKYLEFF